MEGHFIVGGKEVEAEEIEESDGAGEDEGELESTTAELGGEPLEEGSSGRGVQDHGDGLMLVILVMLVMLVNEG